MWSPFHKSSSLLVCSSNYLVKCRNLLTLHKFNTVKVVPELIQIVGDKNVCVSEAVRKQHGIDEGYHKGFPADVVVKPETTEQVSHIAKLCHKNRIPMIPFGVGSGLEGGVIPIKGGVTVNMTQMNEVLEVNPDDFDVTTQPGVQRIFLNNYLRDTGLWFPIDPGADASIGGMASTSASGTNAVRYGTMRENVLNLEVVLADGTIINAAGKRRRPRFRPSKRSTRAGTIKTSAGYNLTNLFVGSEGTLGIFTEITLRLSAIPQTITSAVCSFPTVEDAVRTAIQTLQTNVPIARVELLDEVAIKACNSYSKLTHDEVPTLFLEFHGQAFDVEEQLKAVREIAVNNFGTGFVSSNIIEERNRLWTARHKLFYAILALKPGSKAVVSDVCVPLSKLPHIVIETQRDIRDKGITGAILGHVGDGNFHAVMNFDPNNFEELNTIKGISDRLARRAWAVDGTCTGEHGIGLGKIHLLEGEIGRTGVHVMRQIKEALDPYNIMNPGKILHL